MHREDCSNLHPVIDGRKKMHFWEGDDWIPKDASMRDDVEPEAGIEEQYLPTLTFDQMLPHGHSVEASAGQGYYWRSGIWHIGEVVTPALSINIALYAGTSDPQANILPPWQQDLYGDVPSSWLSECRRHTQFAGIDANLLARLSALGMRPAKPSVRPRGRLNQVTNGCRVPILWTRGKNADITVAALGYAQTTTYSPELEGWLNSLQSSERHHSVPAACEDLAKWLCSLYVLNPMEEM